MKLIPQNKHESGLSCNLVVSALFCMEGEKKEEISEKFRARMCWGNVGSEDCLLCKETWGYRTTKQS